MIWVLLRSLSTGKNSVQHGPKVDSRLRCLGAGVTTIDKVAPSLCCLANERVMNDAYLITKIKNASGPSGPRATVNQPGSA